MAIIKFKQADGNWALVETAAALKYTEQSLTEAQQAQVLANLGLAIATQDSDGLLSKTDKAILDQIAQTDTTPTINSDGVLIFANIAEVGV